MRSFCTRLAVVSGLLTALAAWTHARPIGTPAQGPDFAVQIPRAFDGWVGREAPPLAPDVARALAADEYVHRYYARAAVTTQRTTNQRTTNQRTTNNERRTTNHVAFVEADVAYYARPQAGAAMHSPLNCLPGNGWQIVESRTSAVRAGDTMVDVRRLVVDRKGHRIAMAYWFQNRGAVIATEYRQRIRLLANGLQGAPTDAALVRVMARDTDAGRAAIEMFTHDLMRVLNLAFRP